MIVIDNGCNEKSACRDSLLRCILYIEKHCWIENVQIGKLAVFRDIRIHFFEVVREFYKSSFGRKQGNDFEIIRLLCKGFLALVCIPTLQLKNSSPF